MDKYIKKIYDMLYSPILTPYNLLENAKLPNYSYVKYYTNHIGIVAEMQCTIDGACEKVFYYQFDKKDFLQEIYCEANGVKEVLFDRALEAEAAKADYYQEQGTINRVS